MTEQHDSPIRYMMCINTGAYEDDLKLRTVYRVIPDEGAAQSNYVRIIDETGEDYLYPQSYFVPVEIPHEAEPIFSLAS
jgi:hypothetical protein